MALTARENIRRVFRHEMPEWIPIVGHVDNYNQPSRAGMDGELAGRLEAQGGWGRHGISDFCRLMGLEIMTRTRAPLVGRRFRTRCEGHWEADVYHGRYETPHGVLTERKKRTGDGRSAAPIEYPVKGSQDVPAMCSVFEDEQLELDPQGVEALAEQIRMAGDGGIVTISAPATPLGNCVRMYTGVEALAYLHADHPAALGRLLEAMEDNYLRQLVLIARCNCDAAISYDDTSTTTLSPGMFRDLEMPYIDKAAKILHDAGKFYIHHSCGLIRDLLDLYRRTAMDGVDALTVEPVGNVTIAESKRRLGRKIVMLPGLFPNLQLSREGIAHLTRKMFHEAAPGDNFMPVVFPDPANTMDDLRFLVEQARKAASEVLSN